MNNSLLPVGSSLLEVAAAEALASLSDVPVPLRELWSPERCPVKLLPYLAWAWSVDRWDMDWPESTKRVSIKMSMFVHKHKGTIGAIRRVVEPFGYLIRVINGGKPMMSPALSGWILASWKRVSPRPPIKN
ncbi:putative bacteriophage protein precursor [Photorhabdus asymbiotica]|uniref:Bacteriophage protein n=1 Tax=Photorhabdus asymbiotica subsp. asymbiotica (strain ATCC 43949 / 3105-77) TaxID=553480 RepID=B6VLW9_PHOAA|nr:putative bacteriophage protein precursor [Photorhabdus asymbiotica]CAR67149.1 putative bacteriophage protein precursor [Photorhabdus asymbiotica subsp. asymbiotica ATCC 43949]